MLNAILTAFDHVAHSLLSTCNVQKGVCHDWTRVDKK